MSLARHRTDTFRHFVWLRTACRILPFLCLSVVACRRDTAPRVVDDTALADTAQADDWLAFGRTYHEQRFSPLMQVNDGNVGELGVAWYRELPEDRSLYGTPLVVDGVMYFEGSYNVLRAVDATNGELLWAAGRGARRAGTARPGPRGVPALRVPLWRAGSLVPRVFARSCG